MRLWGAAVTLALIIAWSHSYCLLQRWQVYQRTRDDHRNTSGTAFTAHPSHHQMALNKILLSSSTFAKNLSCMTHIKVPYHVCFQYLPPVKSRVNLSGRQSEPFPLCHTSTVAGTAFLHFCDFNVFSLVLSHDLSSPVCNHLMTPLFLLTPCSLMLNNGMLTACINARLHL